MMRLALIFRVLTNLRTTMARPKRDENQIDVSRTLAAHSGRGSITELPKSESSQLTEDYIAAFKPWQVKIETGVLARDSVENRIARLRNAERALADLELALERDETLVAIANLLESKLDEMLDGISGDWRQGKERGLPPVLNPLQTEVQQQKLVSDNVLFLRRNVSRDERRFLFLGLMTSLLHEYRNDGQSLVLTGRARLLRRLSRAATILVSAVEALNRYPVVENALTTPHRATVKSAIDHCGALPGIYGDLLSLDVQDSLSPVLENNYFQLRSQYTVACTNICLRLYGHASLNILRELIGIKSVAYMNTLVEFNTEIGIASVNAGVSDADIAAALREKEAERQRITDQRKGALNRALKRALTENWPTLPVLQLYKYDERYGHVKVVKRSSVTEEGVVEHAVTATS